MKNFDEYIIEKLRITHNSRELTLGDIYRIYDVDISAWTNTHPEDFLERIDDVFGITTLYELQDKYRDYFKEYEDNRNNRDYRIKNEEINELCKIILNIIFSVPADKTIDDGLKRLIDDCNILPYKSHSLNIVQKQKPTYSELKYDNTLLVHFEFEER